MQSAKETRFVSTPHLPAGKTALAVISGDCSDEIIASLERENIKLMKTQCDIALDSPVSYHADMLCHHCGGGKIILAPSQKKLAEELARSGFSVLFSAPLAKEYPLDIALDCLRLGDLLFGKAGYTDPAAAEAAKEFVPVKQGYSKCSVLIINEHACITEDKALAERLQKGGASVLLIRRGFVGIDGYNCGFIGGAGGKISADTLAFFGDCKQHPDWSIMEEFILENSCRALSLSNEPLFDYGGILPLLEYK